jgi:hypothetical protein
MDTLMEKLRITDIANERLSDDLFKKTFCQRGISDFQPRDDLSDS